MPDDEVIVNVVLSCIISMVGTIGNILVIIAFFAVPSLRSITNVFVLQLAIIDLIKATVVLPTKIANQVRGVTSMNEVYCQIIGVLRTIGSCQPAILLAMIAIVRYFKVVKPHSFSKIFTYKKALIYSSIILVGTITIGLLPVMGLGKYSFSKSHGVCFVTWSKENIAFRTIYYIFNVAFTFPVLVFCYFKIFRTVQLHSARVTPQLGKQPCRVNFKLAEKEGNSSNSSTETPSPYNKNHEPVNFGASSSNETKTSKQSTDPINECLEVELKRDVFTIEIQQSRQLKYVKQHEKQSRYLNRQEMQQKQNRSKLAPKKKENRRRNSRQIELEVTIVMFMIVVVYTMCWMPALIVTILSLSKAVKFHKNLLIFIVTLVDSKVSLNPLIYGFGSKQFRSAFQVVLRRICQS